MDTRRSKLKRKWSEDDDQSKKKEDKGKARKGQKIKNPKATPNKNELHSDKKKQDGNPGKYLPGRIHY